MGGGWVTRWMWGGCGAAWRRGVGAAGRLGGKGAGPRGAGRLGGGLPWCGVVVWWCGGVVLERWGGRVDGLAGWRAGLFSSLLVC